LYQPSPATASPSTYFPETGYQIDNSQFFDFFLSRGGIQTFGYPISREFTLYGFPVQIFQRAILQRYPDGHVQLLNLLDAGVFPYSQVNGAILPPADPPLTETAPSVGSPGYGSAIVDWIAANAPDVWHGIPVGFHRSFVNTVSVKDAFPHGGSNPGLIVGFDLEVWGIPTSAPAFDPNNHNVVYQRFQRGILQYDAACGCTHALLLADYLKDILMGADLPPDLQSAASGSPYFGQYQPSRPASVENPELLPNTDLSKAFDPNGGSVPVQTGQPVQTSSTPPPAVNATAIAVIDESSGALLYSKNPHQHLAPASVTKIFTTLVALKHGTLSQSFTVQFDPAQLPDSTLMGIHPGETYTLEDLLYGLMLPSGNDAALAIANGIGGSEANFVSLMNAQAHDLGLTDSHFVNPHGLDATGHYSSAYDLGMAARYGMTHYPVFQKLAIARTWTVKGTRTFPVYQLNRFLWSYPGADGVKIGYTDAAGKTIVASATRGGHRVYVVLLHCGDIVKDSAPLFDWVFANFTWPGT
jgi:hypothetical protein